MMMKIQSMEELLDVCTKEDISVAETMIRLEMQTSGKDRDEIVGMMKERIEKMKEAVDAGVNDASTAPSGISGGDAVKMKQYVDSGKALSGSYVSDAMTFSMATSES